MSHKKSKIDKISIELFFNNNVFLNKRIIYIDNSLDEINVQTSESVIKALYILKSINNRQITIIINSVGGNEYDAWAIYDTIKSLKINIKTIAQGCCMSAATIIFLAGDKRECGKHCVFMLHDGSDEYSGHRKNLERWADFGKSYRKNAYKLYYDIIKEKKKNITMKKVEELCLLDTIWTAEDAKKYNFVTKIL